MSNTAAKTKEYVRPMPANWFLHNRHLQLFMLRELTAVFVGGYAVFLLLMLYRFSLGTESFHQFFVGTMRNPLVIALQIVALGFVAYHSVTSWNAAPVLMVIWRGDEKVEPKFIVGANYAMWLIVSVLILVIALW